MKLVIPCGAEVLSFTGHQSRYLAQRPCLLSHIEPRDQRGGVSDRAGDPWLSGGGA